jgi:pSer/pThr/pTyr-binding forkhead associated (FHA) protein
LVIVDDEGQETVLPMLREEFTVGRKEGNVIRLTERNVSRFHARIVLENGRHYLSDLGSYTGTRLNGRRIRGKMPLSPGDEVGIGDYVLRMERAAVGATASEPPAEAPKPPQITVVVNGEPGHVHHLSDVPEVIGRGPEATIRIDDPAISAVHARLSLLQGRYMLEDAGSTNGLLVGDERVRGKALEPGDVVHLGRVQLYYTLGPLDPAGIRRPKTVPPPSRSRTPMLLGVGGAVVVVIGALFLLLGRGGGDGKPAAPGGSGEPDRADSGGGAAAVAASDAPEDGVAAVVEATGPVAPEGATAEELLAEARDAASKAGTVAAWDDVLSKLSAPVLDGVGEADALRQDAQRERNAREALDDALDALERAEPAVAARRLAAVPPDVRCASDALGAGLRVVSAGRRAGRERQVTPLREIVEALEAWLGPPTEIDDGRVELREVLARLEPRAPVDRDAGGGREPPGTDAGARPGTDAGTIPGRDVGGTPGRDAATTPADRGGTVAAGGDAGGGSAGAADEAFNRARQMVLANDNAGCVEVLRNAPQTQRNLELLITCYKGAGRMADALDAMQSYVTRYPTGRKTEEYRQVLAERGL